MKLSSPLKLVKHLIGYNKTQKEILIIPQLYPDWHPKAGLPTHFGSAILSRNRRNKIHQMVFYDQHWMQAEQEVRRGKSQLHICYSQLKGNRLINTLICRKQTMTVQIGQLPAFLEDGICVSSRMVSLDEFAANEGLNKEDFIAWYAKSIQREFFIIHFTDFKY